MRAYHKTWWGEEFVRSLEGFIDPGRLQRGRAYRTDSRILSFKITDNIVTAQVRGNINPYFGITKEPRYNIILEFKKIPTSHWQKCIEDVCKNPGWLSKLMLNEIPADLQTAFEPYDFLPRSYKVVQATCSCPDYDNPCKHIAGVYYKIAELLDVTPMLLFSLRGIPVAELHAALQQSELGSAFAQHLSLPTELPIIYDETYFPPVIEAPAIHNLTTQKFWGSNEKIESDLNIEEEAGTQIIGALIKKQGDYPPFWNKQASFIGMMEEFYQHVKRKHKNSLGVLIGGQNVE